MSEIITTLRECAEMVEGGRSDNLTEFWHKEAAEATGAVCLKAAERIEQLETALLVAVELAMSHEPGDSRAVSDVAVSLASVVSDCPNDAAWQIINDHAKALQDAT